MIGPAALAGLQVAYQTLLQHPAVRATLSVEAYGATELRAVSSPMIFLVGPVQSADGVRRVDRAVALSGLPGRLRRRTVSAEDDQQAAKLLDGGWHVLASAGDDVRVAAVALAQRASIVPIGIRGTVAAVEPGRIRPVPGRPRVAVRYGIPLRPEVGETAPALTARVGRAIKELVAEDATSWWAVRRQGTSAVTSTPSGWRRTWQQTERPLLGGRQPPPKIWQG